VDVNQIYVHGCGAVSPAGWGVAPLLQSLKTGAPLATKPLPRPGWEKSLTVRQVPAPDPRPPFFGHARLRRASPISQYLVAAAVEAVGSDADAIASGRLRLGVVLCVMSGCVNYSRRFYDETLRDPATASPLVFPETVFNAPASHIAAILGTPALNYTLVGDSGTFLQGLALAANWLLEDRVDTCLVAGGEECDWLTADAFRLFSRSLVLSDGAGAIYLKNNLRDGALAQLHSVTDSHQFNSKTARNRAAQKVCAELPPPSSGRLLVDGLQNLSGLDAAEAAAWRDWSSPRVSPKTILGEGLMAAAAWQCVLAIDSLRRSEYNAANVSVVGCNQQAIGAHFVKAI
jgi:3-oxoacyl-(acyl-carrier-protein) synthase